MSAEFTSCAKCQRRGCPACDDYGWVRNQFYNAVVSEPAPPKPPRAPLPKLRIAFLSLLAICYVPILGLVAAVVTDAPGGWLLFGQILFYGGIFILLMRLLVGVAMWAPMSTIFLLGMVRPSRGRWW